MVQLQEVCIHAETVLLWPPAQAMTKTSALWAKYRSGLVPGQTRLPEGQLKSRNRMSPMYQRERMPWTGDSRRRGRFPWLNPSHFLELWGFVHKLVQWNAKPGPAGQAVVLRVTADVKASCPECNHNLCTIPYIKSSGKIYMYKIWCPDPLSWQDLSDLWPCPGMEDCMVLALEILTMYLFFSVSVLHWAQ